MRVRHALQYYFEISFMFVSLLVWFKYKVNEHCNEFIWANVQITNHSYNLRYIVTSSYVMIFY